MGDYDCRTQGHHWIDHPEDGRFCFYCDEKYDFAQLYNRIQTLETIMRKLVAPFKASKPLFGAQHLRSVRVGDQVVEELLAAMEGKDD
jgi:hypothetical protein